MNWLITIPVWGAYYTNKFLRCALPSINAALEEVSGDVRFIIHTDDPTAFHSAKFNGSVEYYPVPWERCLYTTFGNCHRAALDFAEQGDAIVFLTSDIVVSRETFVNTEKKFKEGKKAIVVTAARTSSTSSPVGASGRDLLDWGFKHKHPVTEGCYWGVGCNTVTWAIYFEGKHGTVARAFHLHPLAVLNDRPLYFNRETVDLDLLDRFERDEIHVVCSPDEMAFAEISGPEKQIPQGAPLNVDSVVRWARGNTTPLQRWLFSHRLIISGNGDDHLDEGPAAEILGVLG